MDFGTIIEDLGILCRKKCAGHIKISGVGLETSEEWAKVVMNNRNRVFTNVKDILCNRDNKYDIVIGPVADDNMALLFRQYEK